MLKRDSDKLKRAYKALIAREYLDLPIETTPQVSVSIAESTSKSSSSMFFYSSIFASVLVVLLIAL